MFEKCILVLKSLAANYPILRKWGYIFPRIVTVIVSSGMTTHLMESLINFSENFVNSLEERNSDFLFYHDGKKQMDFEIIRKNQYSDYFGKSGFPVMISENPVVKDDENQCFFIFLEGNYFSEVPKVSEIVPFPEEIDTIYKKMLNSTEEDMTEEEKILRAAVYFLEPYLYRSNQGIEVTELLDAVHQLCVMDEEARDINNLGLVFVKTLYEWKERVGFGEMYRLYSIDFQAMDTQKIMVFDDDYVYMSEKLFKQIVEPLINFIPINSLKQGLLADGFIDTGSEKVVTYTVKIRFNKNGTEYDRIRMLRFRRDKLDNPGELSFVDLCCISREGDGEIG